MTRTRGLFALTIAIALAVAAAPAPAQEPADSLEGLRSPGKAVLLSTAATVVPTVVAIVAITGKSDKYGSDDDTGPALLITGAYLFGPAIGHFYAGRPGRAFAGIGVRTLAVAGMVGAAAAAWNSYGKGDDTGAGMLALASMGVGAFSVVYDVARAGHSAKVTNDELRAQPAPSVSAGPGPVAGTLGLRVAVRF